MTPREQDLMARYIYQVVRRLPKDQRDEVRRELEELISDMHADKGSMEDVLMQLGDPDAFAKQYQTRPQYLIGPAYFDTYLWFVKVVLLCTAVPILAVSLVTALGEVPAATAENFRGILIHAVADGCIAGICETLVSCFCAFGAVTLIFAIMERCAVKTERAKVEKRSMEQRLSGGRGQEPLRWTPSYLEPVPDKNTRISRSDSIVGIVFLILFCVLLIFAPHFFSAIFTKNGTVTTVPVFNLDQWGRILPLFVCCLLIGLADEILRLVVGCYCKLVMISNIVCGVLQIVLGVIILKVLPVWNPDFAGQLQSALGDAAQQVAPFFTNWNPEMVSNGLLAALVLITLLEMGVTVYKTVHYGPGKIKK